MKVSLKNVYQIYFNPCQKFTVLGVSRSYFWAINWTEGESSSFTVSNSTKSYNSATSRAPRLYFLFSWFHAIVQERLRYQPLGWANTYEFTDADLRMAFDTLDAALDKLAMVNAYFEWIFYILSKLGSNLSWYLLNWYLVLR